MTQHQTIPLSKLRQSKLNVRKTGGKAVEDLAASIRSTGLQQNLGVIPEGTGFGVVFGGRRLRALQSLHKAGELPEELADGVPCRVLTAEEAQEASLAENTIREAMHPLDQFAAFQSLIDEGKSEAEVAASFGVTETVVRQRLRLARISPKLLKAYGDGEMRLDQLQAFAITEDHARQESHWKSVRGNDWQSTAEQIRRHLLSAEVGRNDARAQLVGVDAYVAAGGEVRRDLFSDEVIILDLPLLDRLAEAALEEAAALLRTEGWGWVEVGGERPHWNAPTVEAEDREFTDEEAAELIALEEADVQTVAIEVRASQLDSPRYTTEQMAAAGARVLLLHTGMAIYRGLLREGAEAPPPTTAGGDEQGTNSGTVQVGTHERAVRQPGDPAFAAVQRMQAEATAIVQLQVATAPHIAMALLVARLAADIYEGWNKPRRWVHIGREAAGRAPGPLAALMRESTAGTQMAAIEAEWQKKLPAKAAGLAEWAVEQESRVLQELLAFLVARELDAVDISAGAKDGVVELARVARADIAADWRPTLEWLGTLPKPVIIAMAQDAAGKKAAAPLEKLKKDDLPAAALPLFPAGWLPKALRPAEKPRKEKAARGKAAAAGDAA